VFKAFGVQAFSGVSLEVRHGEVLDVIGPIGGGQTTPFNVSYGLKPTTGRILFRGEDITGLKPYDICHGGIARTFQLTRPFLDFSVLDNVAAAARFDQRQKQVVNLHEARKAALGVLSWAKLEQRQDALSCRAGWPRVPTWCCSMRSWPVSAPARPRRCSVSCIDSGRNSASLYRSSHTS
jgi:ABC-type branched-subunit amino acid transport system ATPase component